MLSLKFVNQQNHRVTELIAMQMKLKDFGAPCWSCVSQVANEPQDSRRRVLRTNLIRVRSWIADLGLAKIEDLVAVQLSEMAIVFSTIFQLFSKVCIE